MLFNIDIKFISAILALVCMVISLIFSSMAASVAKRNDQLLRDTFRSIMYISPSNIQLILAFSTSDVTSRTIFTSKVIAIFNRKKTRDLIRPHFPPELVRKICLYGSLWLWIGIAAIFFGIIFYFTN